MAAQAVVRGQGVALAAVLAALLLLTGCGAGSPGTQTPVARSSEPPSAPASPAPATNTPPAAAVAMMRLWSRTEMPYQQWWSDLQPHLSAQARQDLVGTEPAQVPSLRISGRARVTEQSNGVWARVSLPTSVGTFGVQLTRSVGHPAWLVARLEFPPGVH